MKEASGKTNPIAEYLGAPIAVSSPRDFVATLSRWYETIRARAESLPDLSVPREGQFVPAAQPQHEVDLVDAARFFGGETLKTEGGLWGSTSDLDDDSYDQRRESNYEEILASSTKDVLTTVRRRWGFQGMVSLNKASLAEELAHRIIHEIPQHFSSLDTNLWLLFRRLVTGPIYAEDADERTIHYLKHFESYGVVFSVGNEAARRWLMPASLTPVFQSVVTDPTVEEKIELIDTYLTAARGLLLYYGVIPSERLMQCLADFGIAKLDGPQVYQLLEQSLRASVEIRSESLSYWRAAELIRPARVLSEQRRRYSLEYYPVTLAMANEAAGLGHVAVNSHQRKLGGFLSQTYAMSATDAEQTLADCLLLVNNGLSERQLATFLAQRLGLADSEAPEGLTQAVSDFYDHTHQWRLKGHTPLSSKL